MRFALKPRDALGIARDQVPKHLDRDIAAEPDVTGAIDFAHAAGAQLRIISYDPRRVPLVSGITSSRPPQASPGHRRYAFPTQTRTHKPQRRELPAEIAGAAHQLFSEFFAGDGATIPATSPYLEAPMSSSLPMDYDTIP